MLLLSGRMAYLVDLEEEDSMDCDVPTTLIRSKTDCPNASSSDASAGLKSTNDLVVNKLTQILAYLRQGTWAE